jgi:D-cysteine desulfhydrase
LLGDAVQKRTKKIITFGCVGTNHGLATACYSKQLGLDCLLMLKSQPNSRVVRQNLLLDHYFNAQIALFSNNQVRKAALDAIVEQENDTYFIPTGGSVPLGALGYVNAAFELKDQIQKGMLPEPDFIYLPIGSCGTTAGLLLGFALAKINSKIIGVAIEPEEAVDELQANTQKLFLATNELLHAQSTEVPLVEFPEAQLMINKDFCGEYYGQWLPTGDDAAQLMKNEENINLEGTYSAKAFAALIADVKNNSVMKDKVILFWNTYCGLDFSQMINTIDYHELNPEVHGYFE